MVEVDGAIPGQHLLKICLQRAFALPHLLGPPLLGRLAIFGSNLVGIDEGLRAGGSRHGERNGGDDYELFQMSLRKKAHSSARAARAQTANSPRPPGSAVDFNYLRLGLVKPLTSGRGRSC